MTPSSPGPDAAAVARAAAGLGRVLSDAQAGILAGYLNLLLRWRGKANLVGPGDWETILATLVADSWHVADFLASPAAAAVLPSAGAPLVCLDFGAGAGLPGVPLRAFWDRGAYVLLEARTKRAAFLREAAARLPLPGLSVAEGRVEATVPAILAHKPEVFVLCLSRAFAPWPRFLEICRDLVRRPMAVLTMTGEAPAPQAVPSGFVLATGASYGSGGSGGASGRTRYVSLFAPESISM